MQLNNRDKIIKFNAKIVLDVVKSLHNNNKKEM